MQTPPDDCTPQASTRLSTFFSFLSTALASSLLSTMGTIKALSTMVQSSISTIYSFEDLHCRALEQIPAQQRLPVRPLPQNEVGSSAAPIQWSTPIIAHGDAALVANLVPLNPCSDGNRWAWQYAVASQPCGALKRPRSKRVEVKNLHKDYIFIRRTARHG